MRTRDLIIVFVCIFLAGGLFIAAGLQLDPINHQRQEMKLVIDKPENLPPTLAFATVATGAFRGLLVDFLWIRADRLKEAGQFFDAKQLAEWITILQPRFASVWQFHAWNMAYNISVAIPETQPEQRWRWVKNGYELIRDEAIDKYKLRDFGLYHELGRIFQHKIGGISDEAHKYYKLQLAKEMAPLLKTVDTQPQLTGDDNKYFDLLAEAPVTWREILLDPNIAGFVNALKAADTKFADESDFIGNYIALREDFSRYNQDAGNVIDKFRGSETLGKFDIFARAYQLRKVWKLDPVLMRKVNQMYGPVDWKDPNTHLPMDWRHADCHAIYWAVKGLESAEQSADAEREISSAETNTDRIVVHSLHNLFRMGKLIILPVKRTVLSDDPSKGTQTVEEKEVFPRPDVRYFKPYNEAVSKVIKKYDNDKERGTYETLRNGYRNMLKNAVLLFFQSGHRDQAQEVYNYMKEQFPLPEFDISLVEFAQQRMSEELKAYGYQDALEQIPAVLKEGYYYLAIGEDDAAAARENDAKMLYNHYKTLYGENTRTDLAPFENLKFLSMQDFLDDEQFPEYIRKDLFLGRLELANPEVYKLLMEAINKKNQKTE